MKILCSYSGLEFQTQYFPGYLESGEYAHPVFAMPLKKLWRYLPKWQTGELTDIDSYLLFLGTMKATELVRWNTPVLRTTRTTAIVQQNMEHLFRTIGNLVAIKHPKFSVPEFIISEETRNLDNIKYWLDAWDSAIDSFHLGLKDQDMKSKLQKREVALERLIKTPSIKPEKYANILAMWASEAGDFPQSTTPVNGTETTISDYWQEIIIKCHDNIGLISIPEKDLVELLEHCEENIDAGSIFAFHLFNTLRDALDTIRGFFSIGATTFTLVDTGAIEEIEKANLDNLIKSAPVNKPKRTDYPTDFAFMKAKMKWSLAQSYTSGE